MKKTHIFTGVATALVTPFRDGKIDYAALEKLIELQLTGGADALVVAGTTGESATLDADEHRKIIAFTVHEVCGKVPVIAGAGSNNTRHACELAYSAAEAGADALLSVTPYYNKCNTKGLLMHFGAVAKAAEKPIIVYNVPSRTGMGITKAQYSYLAELDGIVAVKEAGRDVGTALRAMAACEGRLTFYSGNDDLTLPLMALGAKGVISVASNAVPHEMKQLTDLLLAGDIDEARKQHCRLLPLFDRLSSDINPMPIKALLAENGLIKNELRLPLA